jgi:hypothetical protein
MLSPEAIDESVTVSEIGELASGEVPLGACHKTAKPTTKDWDEGR